jgi:hypothetical protein
MSRKSDGSGEMTPEQRALVDTLVHRFRLGAAADLLANADQQRRFLDFFAFEPGSGTGGIRNVGVLIARIKDGASDAEIAGVLDTSRETVRLARRMLLAAGYDLDEEAEPLDEDPEESFYRRQERELEEGSDRPRRPGKQRYGEVVARALGEAMEQARAAASLDRDPKGALEAPGPAGTPQESAALSFLWTADFTTRRKWCRRAERKGVKLPPAATAHHNLGRWVGAVAADIVVEERLRIRG